MRRTDLEAKLAELGWKATGRASGRNHAEWAHAKKSFKLYIPLYDLVLDSTAERILADAEGK